MPSTRTRSATPGMVMTQGWKNMYGLPSAIIRPQDGSGGCTPSPRKDKAASSRIACAISRVATTISALRILGRISWARIRTGPKPAALAAATKSWPRTCRVAARVTTAKRSQSRKPSTSTTTFSEPPTSEAMASATSTTGMASRVVTM